MSEQEIPGFRPVEKDGQGRLSAEHEETRWTIKAPNRETLTRMAVLVRRAAARLVRDGGGR